MSRARSLKLLSGLLVVGTALLAVAAMPGPVAACPFCSAVSLTFSEEMDASDAVVIATLLAKPDEADTATSTTPDTMSTFEVLRVIKGEEHIKAGERFQALYFGSDPDDTHFLLMATEPPTLNWSTPIAVTPRAEEYMQALPGLPESGADRLAFFQEYFEDPEDLLARDAYDEFARAPYAEVKALRDRMHHDRLVGWIQDQNVTTTHRRLYLTMLGVCGDDEDIAMLEELIGTDDREARSALDALIACYLTLKGAEGLPLVEDLFLKNPDAEYVDTYAAIMAVRFHGQEEEAIPRERLVEALRHMLDRPELADLVIPDLARWEDWSVVDRLVKLFKEADESSSWVRVPVVNFLRACPLPEAEDHLAVLAEIDPEAVQRASQFFPLGGNALADAPPADADTEDADESATGDLASADATPSEAQIDASAAAAEEEPADSEPSDETQVADTTEAVAASSGTEGAAEASSATHSATESVESSGATEEENPSVAAIAEGNDDAATAPPTGPVAVVPVSTRVLVVLIPLAIGGVLFAAYWVLLRAGRRQAAA